jgi:FG-GAP-like repeat
VTLLRRSLSLSWLVVLAGLVLAFAGLALVMADSAGAQPLPTDESAFQIGRRFPLIGYPTTLAAADLDDDGLPDLIVAESIPNRIAIWWNDGRGGLEPTPTVIADLPAFAAVAIDANGDGTPDVVWTDSLGLHRAIVRPGRQVGAPKLIVEAQDLGPLAVGDLDRNGRDDLVFGAGSKVEWMRAGPSGLAAPAVLESTGTNVTVLAISARDERDEGDKHDEGESGAEHRGHDDRRAGLEIAVAHEWSYDEPPPDIDVLRIDRHGAVAGVTEVPPPKDLGPVWSLVLADLDQDGAMDLVVGGERGAAALWGDDFRDSSTSPIVWPTDAFNLAVADIDGDGHPDVVTESQYGRELPGEGTLCVFSGLGSRRFISGTQYIPDPEIRGGENTIEYPGLILTDMNGDGQPDIVMVESRDYYSSGRRILIALSDAGHGVGLERIDRLSDAPYLSNTELYVTQGPGRRRDRLMVDLGSGTEFVHFGDGGKLIAESGPDLHGPLLFADVDGDGREDAMEVRDSFCVVHFDWSGRTEAVPETVAVPGLRCAADLERDRGMALVGADALGRIVIAQRQRSGHYAYQTLPSSLLVFDHETWDLPHYLGAVAKPGVHGRPDDLIVSASTFTPKCCGPSAYEVELLLLRRDTQGVWRELQDLSTPMTESIDHPAPHPFVVADMNGDGRPDVLVLEYVSEGFGGVHVFLSNPDGTLAPPLPQVPGLSEEPKSFAVADIDRDGSPDVVIGAAEESNTPWLAVCFGDGQGQFDRTAILYLGTIDTDKVGAAITDLDGDGIPDVTALSSSYDGTVLSTIFGADRKTAPPRRHPSRVPIVVTAAPPLAIAAISPMPARDAFDVRFTAPTPEPTRFELLDVTGRRVTERTVNTTEPAHFAVGDDLHSGVYWLRLTQGARTATARVVVLR